MCTINWQLLLEYLKVALNWPPVALLITLAVVKTFREPIAGLIGRLVEGKVLGQEFKASAPQQSATAAPKAALLNSEWVPYGL